MIDKRRTYICIDLKSFYASVECVERGLDPMTTNLVVADSERSDKTICLAVSPSMKTLGVKNRCRVFEIPKNIDYIMATPRMQKYIDYSAEIYGIYLKYFSKEDIHVYSIDESFIDITGYLSTYKCTPKELAIRVMEDVRESIGVRATCGIGSNLYLTKIALDITAKHSPDFIGQLDEESYRSTLWNYKPLTDFWRIGPGIARRLEKIGIYTMGQLANADEDLLYDLFGVDAELLMDHAWGREPVTMRDIKEYKPKTNCISSGQVLMRDYTFDECRTIIKEMTDAVCLEMTQKNLVTDSITLYVGYGSYWKGLRDGGTVHFEGGCCEESKVIPEVLGLYDRCICPDYMIRRVSLTCNNVTSDDGARQLSIFDLTETVKEKQKHDSERDRALQEAVLSIKEKYGKNAMLKGVNFREEATGRQRNLQIGGHKSGEEQ
ncbi:MAG: DNA repair protein [Firmicutes bacterium]|nr:DNA repair protein [Bacillota bacterium]